MSWLDKAINFISPKWGAKRAAWRMAQDNARMYEAADPTRLNEDFMPSMGPAELENNMSRQLLRGRARALEQNSDVMHAILSARERNIIGDGFTLQARTPSEKLNEKIEAEWKRWCRARFCDVTGQQSFMQMMRMALQRKTIDGGVLIVKRYIRDRTEGPKLALQIVEVDELDATADRPASGNRIVGGIEYNEYNRPVAYYVQQYHADGLTQVAPTRIDAKDVLFFFTKNRPTQIREISDVAQTILRIDAIDSYVRAEEVKHKIMACLAVMIESSDPSTALSNGRRRQEGDYPEMSLVPGMVKYLKPGQKTQVINPTGQATDATQFVKMLMRLASSGQGISYEAVSRDLSSTNYSSARQGAVEDTLAFASDIEHLTNILDEIYESFVISCVQNDVIKIGHFWANKDKYLAHEWIRRPKPWIDPLKEANATKVALESGIKTLQQVAAENGTDWRDQMDDIAEMLKYGETLGIDIGALIYNGKLAEKAGTQDGPATDGGGDSGDESGADGSAADGSSQGSDQNPDTGSENKGEAAGRSGAHKRPHGRRADKSSRRSRTG